MTDDTFRFTSSLPFSAADTYRWHVRPGAFDRLSPPWEDVRVIRPPRVVDGECAVFEVPMGPLSKRWVARHEAVSEDRSFRDVQVSGPFARWEHTHSFAPAEDGCTLNDEIVYRMPFGFLGRLGRGFVRRRLERLFAFRHDLTRRDLTRHAGWSGGSLKIAVSGASGLVGRALCAFLRTGGHEVVELVRDRDGDRADQALWSVEHGVLEPERLEGCDALVHLAGAGIADRRWSDARKEVIRSSRIDGTRNLLRSLGQSVGLPPVVAVASAVGFYGDRSDEVLDESSSSGAGFLAEVCREWETAAREECGDGVRLAHLRFGVITTSSGGALAKMLLPFKLGAGGPVGNGRQWMSWVSLDDAVHAIHHVLTHDDVSGPVNVVAPAAVTNRDWARALGGALRRPAFASMPAPIARVLFGELAEELLLSGQRVAPGVLERSGFRFFDQDLATCFRRLLGREFAAGAVPGRNQRPLEFVD